MKPSTEELTLGEIDRLAQTLYNTLGVGDVAGPWDKLTEGERELYHLAARAMVLKLQIIGAERAA
jgi:hypothetical protein